MVRDCFLEEKKKLSSSRFGARDYITDPFFKLNKMLSFSPEEVVIGSLSSLSYMLLVVFLFRKSQLGRKNKSRFDKVIEREAEAGKLYLPEKSFTAPEPPE